MILFNPSHVGLLNGTLEPSAVNYVRQLYAEEVTFDCGEHYWGQIDGCLVTDGETTYTTKLEPIEATPGTVIRVRSAMVRV